MIYELTISPAQNICLHFYAQSVRNNIAKSGRTTYSNATVIDISWEQNQPQSKEDLFAHTIIANGTFAVIFFDCESFRLGFDARFGL